jgi:hypothetical protein
MTACEFGKWVKRIEQAKRAAAQKRAAEKRAADEVERMTAAPPAAAPWCRRASVARAKDTATECDFKSSGAGAGAAS